MSQDLEDVVESISEEAPVEPQSEDTEPQEEPSEQQSEEPSSERNWKALRDSKRQLESEVEELRQQMQRLSSPKEEAEPELGDDDLVEYRQLKKLKKEITDHLQQSKAQTDADRLKSKFPDIEEVVSRENLEKLKQTEPELYASVVSAPDFYSRGVSAYKTLTAMGIVKKNNYDQEKEQVQRNHGKPRSVQAVKGQGALADANAFANGLTPALRKQLYEEMVEAQKLG